MFRCPECGKENKAGSNFCSACGHGFLESQTGNAQKSNPAQTVNQTMFAHQPAAQPPNPMINGVNQPRKSKKGILIAALCFVLIGLLGGASLFLFTDVKDLFFANDKQKDLAFVGDEKTSADTKKTDQSAKTDADLQEKVGGRYEVGDDIQAGEYVIIQDNSTCSYQIMTDSSGDSSSILVQGDIHGKGYINLENGQYLQIDGGRLSSFPLADSQSAVVNFNAPDLAQYQTYTNPRFGFDIKYPEFFIPKPDPANGDGKSFISPDGKTSLTVWGSHSPSTLGQSTKEYYQANLANIEGEITYKACGDTWYAIASIQGDSSFYQKTFVGQDENSFLLKMPTEQVDYYRGIIDVMEKQFHAGFDS